MKTTNTRKLPTALILFPMIVFLLDGCTDSVEDGLPGKVENTTTNSTYHPSGWKDNSQHGIDYSTNPQNCKACHGNDLQGGSSGVSCESCHHSGWSGTHGEAFAEDPNNCKGCHGEDLDGDGDQDRDCSFCHHEEAAGQWQHGDYHTLPDTDNCTNCHGADFTGANTLVSCFSCHSEISAFDCTDCHTGAATSHTDSAHGNTLYGVDRSDIGYAQGDCTQCHDLPAGSTNDLLLFADMNQTTQDNNFCFQCHQATADSVQDSMTEQYSYSERAGNWAADPVDDVKEAFSNTSSHNLGNIVTFITGKWGFTADSNPCAACHNPHAAQRELHAVGNRGWPVTLPSKHGSSVPDEQLWGDDDEGERMDDYTDYYQAPYRFGGDGDDYEPDDSGIADGFNLTDYATFCQDCHTSTMTDYGLTHTDGGIDWTTTGDESNLPDSAGGDKHGKNIATGNVHYLEAPYAGAWTASGLVLSCTDCHEPHGSSSGMLIRGEVNGGQVTIGSIGTDNKDLAGLCLRCHENNMWCIHHQLCNADAPYDTTLGVCNDCHFGALFSTGPLSICSNCHVHGGDDSWLLTAPTITNGNDYYTGRRTF